MDQLVVLVWQFSQMLVVSGCVAERPSAVVPLWQEEQPDEIPECEKLAGVQAVVRWQLPQSCDVVMWVAVFPVAVEPLWHDEQVPSTCE